MSKTYLDLRAVGGSSIEDCAKEAQELTDKLEIDVEFAFNGVLCCATPGGKPETLIEQYRLERKTESEFHYACSK